MRKIIILVITIFISLVWILSLVSAHCPLCITGAAAGVGVARFYGVHDSLVGLWLGGFVASTAFWFDKWLKKKKINFPLQSLILVVLSFLVFVVPLYVVGIIIDFNSVRAMPQNYSVFGMGIYGIDSLLFGIILGTLLILGTFSLSDYLKKKNGKRLFAFQSLSFMFIALAIFSLILWVLT